MVESQNTTSFIVSTNERYRTVYLHVHLTVLPIIVLSAYFLLCSYVASIRRRANMKNLSLLVSLADTCKIMCQCFNFLLFFEVRVFSILPFVINYKF